MIVDWWRRGGYCRSQPVERFCLPDEPFALNRFLDAGKRYLWMQAVNPDQYTTTTYHSYPDLGDD
jgi:hypothetical protein